MNTMETALKAYITFSTSDGEKMAALSSLLAKRRIFVVENANWTGQAAEQIIECSDVCVIIFSRNAASSRIVRNEIAIAAALGKPVICLSIEPGVLIDPDLMHGVTWYMPYQGDTESEPIQFEYNGRNYIYSETRTLSEAVQELEKNERWIHEHANLLERARRWDELDRPNGLLMNPEEADIARVWRDTSQQRAVPRLSLISAYIEESLSGGKVCSSKAANKTSFAAGLPVVFRSWLLKWRPGRNYLKTFISYRRKDTGIVAEKLHAELSRIMGANSISLDVKDFPPGVDFRKHIGASIQQSNCCLVLIGPNWLDARADNGWRRLDSPRDHVRTEIEHAFGGSKTIIPILVGDTKMPIAEDLPVAIRQLAYINAISLRPGPFFGQDLQEIVKALAV